MLCLDSPHLCHDIGMPAYSRLLATLSTLLLAACGSLQRTPVVWPIDYPGNSPEWVAASFDGGRYLLAHWNLALRGNPALHMRWYEPASGTLTPLPVAARIYRLNPATGEASRLRYTSDNPRYLVLFTEHEIGRRHNCAWKPNHSDHCSMVEILVSVDGGRRFDTLQLAIDSRVDTSSLHAFIDIHQGVAYLGIDTATTYLPGWRESPQGSGYFDQHGQAVALQRTAMPGSQERPALMVVAVPLSGLPDLVARRQPVEARTLTGEELLAYPTGPAMQILHPTPPQALPAPAGHYNRGMRARYIESLRTAYPQWAAHQSLAGLPWWGTRYGTAEETARLAEKLPPPPDDPVDWVRLDDIRLTQ